MYDVPYCASLRFGWRYDANYQDLRYRFSDLDKVQWLGFQSRHANCYDVKLGGEKYQLYA